jgi:predicted DNA-binding transcriptional regulator AlpA
MKSQNNQNNNKLYTRKEILEMLQVASPTLSNWVFTNQFVKPIKIGRRIYWIKDDVDKFLNNK